jgi:Pentapeptide repeats (8 copies)
MGGGLRGHDAAMADRPASLSDTTRRRRPLGTGTHRTPRPIRPGAAARAVRDPRLHRATGRRGNTRLRTPRSSVNWTAIASVIAALAGAAGLYFTGRSLEATRVQNAVVEQGQLTDRFTKAVDQLDRAGADHLQARLGGIYALERLARDSPRDQPTVMEVLSAFTRSTAPHRPRTESGDYSPCPDQPPTADVQAALTVLSRRNPDYDRSTRIDLSKICLLYTDLSRAVLQGANLFQTDLLHANLSSADLHNTNLIGVNLKSANLMAANLRSADVTGANLAGADLTDADLSSANLGSANLFVGRHERTNVESTITDQRTTGVWWK